MALNKLRRLDGNSLGVTLPKDDLREAGLLDEDGELVEDVHLGVRYREGEWRVTIDPLDELDRREPAEWESV
jgi:antitoxin component of MazEF toxin-antitoxin module